MRKIVKEMKFRRRREQVTDYKKRLALVKSGLERVVVRRSNKRIIGQVVRYAEKSDVVVRSADSNELRKKYSWPSRSNRPTAYLTGLLLAKKGKEKGEGELVLDIGITTPVKNSIPFVFAKGCIDGGMKLRGTFEIKEEMYNASQIAKYAEQLKGKQEAFKRQFGAYAAGNMTPEKLPELFNQVRSKILEGS